MPKTPFKTAVTKADAGDVLLKLLDKPDVQSLIRTNHELAELALRTGPNGDGWQFNAGLRPRYEAQAAFWSALTALI